MARILVTGGAGGLGREIVNQLITTPHTVRVMSRSSAPADLDSRIEWAQADVENGDGLAQVVEGVDVIVNSMSLPSNMQAVDIGGTRRLLEAGKKVGLAHVLHISIVGIERIPNPYYNAKVEAEQVVIDSGVPYSIWRATQFHSLLDGYLAPLRQGYTAQVQTWLAAQGITRTIQYAPGNAEIGAALRQGYNTIPSNPYGKITWSDYLNEKYGQKNPERAG
jgi:uncharacterized protein YbjT (DUF2867 family)